MSWLRFTANDWNEFSALNWFNFGAIAPPQPELKDEITSVVGRYSGNIAYKDGTNGLFHAQIEMGMEDLSWSIDQAVSRYNVGQIAADAVFGEAFREIIDAAWPSAEDSKPIEDMASHLHLRATSRNRSYNLEFVYENRKWRPVYDDAIPASDKGMRGLNKIIRILGG